MTIKSISDGRLHGNVTAFLLPPHDPRALLIIAEKSMFRATAPGFTGEEILRKLIADQMAEVHLEKIA